MKLLMTNDVMLFLPREETYIIFIFLYIIIYAR